MRQRPISPRALASAAAAAALLLAAADSASAQVLLGTGASPQVALSNAPVTIRSGRGALQWADCWNPNAAVEFVLVYDTAATPVPGTTPPKVVIPVAPTSSHPMPSFGPSGVGYTAALKVAASASTTANTAPAAPLVCTFGFQ